MSRRGFLKWLFAAIAVVAGSFTALFQWLTRINSNGAGTPPSADVTTPQPLTEQPPARPAQPTGLAEPLLSFFILSDLHISVYDEAPSKKLKWALDDISKFESKVETICITGDLTDYGRDVEYKELKSILNGYKLPDIYGNMGNHDYYDIWIDKNGSFNRDTMPNGKKDAASRERFMKFFGYDKPYHAVSINGYQLILMSQEAYVQEKPEVGEGAWYSDEQLEWLKAKLAENRDGKPVFVMIHQPLPPAGQDGGSHRLIRANAFRDILKPYPNVFVFSGHQHLDFENGSPHYYKETFHWFHNSSVGRARGTKDSASKAQGLYVQVYEDRVVLRGREFSKKAWISAADWTVKLEQRAQA